MFFFEEADFFMTGNFFLLALVLWPMLGAVISFISGMFNKNLRDYVADLVCVIELAGVVACYKFIGSELHIPDICGTGLNFKLDGFRFIYAVIIAFMWTATTIFSREYLEHHKKRNRYYFYILMTFGSIMGVFLSSDLFTTFIFFEMMSLFSYVMVVQDETPEALRAAQTYLAIAIIGGLATLTGLIFLYSQTGTLEINKLLNPAVKNKKLLYISGALIFSGFAAKAAIFPSHIWLPTAHTAAPAPSSALLSGLLTKSGLFGVLILSCNIFAGDKIWAMMLLILALITMTLGAVLAVFSVNIKRTLACSSMSQIGFILTGVSMQCFLGHDNDLAVRGTILYMVGHSLIKLVLFLCAGVVHMNTHKLNLNDIRGFGRGKKIFMFAFLMGGLGLAGVPLLNGYLGKTLIHESILEYIHELSNTPGASTSLFKFAEWLFLISGGLTVSYVLKLFAVLFIAEPSENLHTKEKYLSRVNSIVLVISASALPIIGLMPYKIADVISFMGAQFMNGSEHHHAVNYFSLENLEGALISLGIGAVIYLYVVKKFFMDSYKNYECVNLWPAKLDIENLIFRPVIANILPFIGALFAKLVDLITAGELSVILNRASKIKLIRAPEDKEFGLYVNEPERATAEILLPSSMDYSFMAYSAGLLFIIILMLV